MESQDIDSGSDQDPWCKPGQEATRLDRMSLQVDKEKAVYLARQRARDQVITSDLLERLILDAFDAGMLYCRDRNPPDDLVYRDSKTAPHPSYTIGRAKQICGWSDDRQFGVMIEFLIAHNLNEPFRRYVDSIVTQYEMEAEDEQPGPATA